MTIFKAVKNFIISSINFFKQRKLAFFLIAVVIIAAAVVLTRGNGQKSDGGQKNISKPVKVQAMADSGKIIEELNFSGLVGSAGEAKIFARVGGVVKEIKGEVGKEVKMGDWLIKVDDTTGGSQSAGFNSGLVKQAMLGVEQAASALRLAQTNYQNTLQSFDKDLNSAAIARDQAAQGKANLNLTADEAIKSAEIGYQTAQIAAAQAKANLDNGSKSIEQNKTDAVTNAQIAADSAGNTSHNAILNINAITDLDENLNIDISYKNNLGVLDLNSLSNAQAAYQTAQNFDKIYQAANYASLAEQIEAAIKLAGLTNELADAIKYLLDNTITSSVLQQSSLTGPSLSGLQATAAGYQAQMTGVLSLANGAKQVLANVNLNTNSGLENLEKFYELARQQEAGAKQALENLKAGNKAQLDQAGFGSSAAANQFESSRIRLNTQVAAAKNQQDMAALAYQTAAVNLQNLYDAHLLISPINGTLVNRMVSVGDTVALGQLLAVVGQPKNLQLEFFVDQDNLKYLQIGKKIKVKNSSGDIFDATITAVASQADDFTKRFLVQAGLKDASARLSLGTVVDISIAVEKKPIASGAILLPLTSLDIGQNGNSIFIVDGTKAKKMTVEILKLVGEYAEVKVDLPKDALIIVDGNKRLAEGDTIEISK